MCLLQDSTVVTVFFEKELPDRAACSDPDPVVVVLEGYLSGGQRKSFSITADRYNPYTCQFTAPRKPSSFHVSSELILMPSIASVYFPRATVVNRVVRGRSEVKIR